MKFYNKISQASALLAFFSLNNLATFTHHWLFCNSSQPPGGLFYFPSGLGYYA